MCVLLRVCLAIFSIHASAKEATLTANLINRVFGFQSTPPRRRRLCRTQTPCLLQVFNPRLREGGDHKRYVPVSAVKFSIHASAKEATRTALTIHFSSFFNPRLREGGDMCVLLRVCLAIFFNPRLREGGDVFPLGSAFQGLFFNPRLREGGDKRPG